MKGASDYIVRCVWLASGCFDIMSTYEYNSLNFVEYKWTIPFAARVPERLPEWNRRLIQY